MITIRFPDDASKRRVLSVRRVLGRRGRGFFRLAGDERSEYSDNDERGHGEIAEHPGGAQIEVMLAQAAHGNNSRCGQRSRGSTPTRPRRRFISLALAGECPAQ